MHSACVASVWPSPEMSSFSPSTVISATRVILRRIDRLAAMGHLALRQRVLDEHGIDGLQIILRGQVHHREIFVIEIAVLVDQIAVALHQILEQGLVGVHVAVEIHA